MTASILTLTLALKFDEGGWVTVLITGALIGLCLLVKGHYHRVEKAIAELERQIGPRTHPAQPAVAPPRDPKAPTAVLLVKGFDGRIINGIKDSKDAGASKVRIGDGTVPKVISGTKDGGDTGIRNVTAGNSAAIKVMTIGKGVMAGNGAALDKSTIGGDRRKVRTRHPLEVFEPDCSPPPSRYRSVS
jgi:hypothetical protein